MRLLILGRGKTGSLVVPAATRREHHARSAGSAENSNSAALTLESLNDIDAVVDFTTPSSVLHNIEACIKARKPMVVGTTGWYGESPRIKRLVESEGAALVYAANFSIGVNLFLDVARAAAAALQHGYSGQIFERHHVHKKDAPSGTAIAIQNAIQDAIRETSDSGPHTELEITSFREGEVVGMHEVTFDSSADKIYICHDAKSRTGFAEGAVRAAEWIVGKKGFYDFKDIWRDL